MGDGYFNGIPWETNRRSLVYPNRIDADSGTIHALGIHHPPQQITKSDSP